MANNPYVNKVQKADGTTIIDISDTTATASDVASGKYFYTAAGAKTQGTATGGGGTVTITDTLDSVGGTIRTITTDPAATIVEALNITQNGTYTPSAGHAYGLVVANVGGGGYTLLGSKEFTVNTTSSSTTNVGTIDCGASAWTADKIIVATVEDKAGKRNSYFLSSCSALLNQGAKNGVSPTALASFPNPIIIYVGSSGVYNHANVNYGVYASNLSNGVVTFYAKYSSSYGTINGTYICSVWALDFPTGFNPWGD